jgi:thiosulfate dehydrogenase [quinone] large subunit
MSALRRLVLPLAIVAAAIVVYLEAPFTALGFKGLEPGKDVATFLSGIFLILAVIVVFALYQELRAEHAESVPAEDGDGPAFTRYLFHNPRAGLIWLPIRLFVGFAWLGAGLHKLQGTGWLDGGSALAGFWNGAAAIPVAPAKPAITFDWYRDFLNLLISNHAETWFSWLIVFGEIAVGLGLIFGGLTWAASFFGALMNMSFMLAGSSSTNPVLFVLAVGLLLAWRVSGYYGIDRYLLPIMGVGRAAGTKPHATATPQVGTPMTA